MPLYRLEQSFARQQVQMARSTMCAWLTTGAQVLKPLVELMIARVKQSLAIHTDDTCVPIQSPGEKKCRNGRPRRHIGDIEPP